MKQNRKYSSSRFSLAFSKLAVTFSILFILASCAKDESTDIPITDVSAPAFSLKSLDGSQVQLSDYKDKLVVLFFFGNTCPSCKAAAPNIVSMLSAPFASRSDFKILGLDQWNGNAASVQAFKTATGITFPLLLSASGVAADYKTTYDRIVIIDKTGKIVFSGTQGAAADIPAAKAKIEMLLGTSGTPPASGIAPAFELNSLSGSKVKLSDYSNKVVVLFFFGNTCPACIGAAPSVESMLVTPFASNTNYMVLGLDQWNGNLASVQAFKTATGVSFALLLNASGVAADYKTTYDRIVVIDKTGKIAFTGKQSAASDIAAAKTKVMDLLAK